ncbi:MAG: ABC transporter substrate-binding protein [Anaerolineales bacterium]|nr:ABC transporter substrate-binding protein [Anaerolineales bacterium]
MSSKRIVKLIPICILALAVLGGCGAAGSKEGSVYKIGFSSAATGNYASLGLPEAKTAEMIQKQINDQGGITGPDGVKHEVEIIILDDANEADKAVSNVTRLITEDEVIAVVSSTGSGTSVAQIPVCEENETPCVSMASAATITTNPDTGAEYKWMFKTPQTNGHAGEWQAAYLKAKGVKNICILSTNDGYGKDCLANYKATAEAAGLTVVYEGNYAATDTEFSAQMAGVQASGCEAVEIGSTPPVASLATIAVRNALPDLPVTLGHGVCNQSYITTAGQAADGAVFPCGKVTVVDQLPDSDPQKAVLTKYIADYTEFTGGEAVSTFGGHGWDALEMIVDALESLKDGMSLKDQRAAVRDYLENKVVDWPGISGTFTMSPSDHTGLTKESLLFVTVRDGKWVAFPEADW